jgi:FkbM family methyltransferase
MNYVTKHAISAVAYLAYLAGKSSAFRRMLFNSIRLNRLETERFRKHEEYKFLSYVFLKRNESKSQILQDLWVCYELNEKREGFFVEFGATNGLVNSNTWLLEKKLQWKGILAEPNPFWHSLLSVNRSSAIDHRCVHSGSGEMISFLATEDSDPELSSIAMFANGDHFAEVRARGAPIQVKTVSLNDLLMEHNAPTDIDYLSIDTEGSEYEILSRFDFARYRVRLISVEQNRNTETNIESLLRRHGFCRVFKEFSQWDGWYVQSVEQRHQRLELDAEPNLGSGGTVMTQAPVSRAGKQT